MSNQRKLLILLVLAMRFNVAAPLRLLSTRMRIQQSPGFRLLATSSIYCTSSTPSSPAPTPLIMEDLISFSKRRGFIFKSSEIYNGFAGFYDYGPLGSELKKNIKDQWWRKFVREREDVIGLDSSIICSPKVWEASGHVGCFSDPMCDCKESKLRYRADKLVYGEIIVGGETLGYVCVEEDDEEKMLKDAKKQAKKILKEQESEFTTQQMEPLKLKNFMEAPEEIMPLLPSPATGKATLTPPRDFNLMFETSVGAMSDGSAKAYLRPETAQGIFVNFKNSQATSRSKVPFGIAQIGKAFRNEITPRNFICEVAKLKDPF